MEEKKKVIVVTIVLEILSFVLFFKYGYHWLKIIRYLFLIGCLVILAVIDQKCQRIPNRILLIMTIVRGILLVGEIICFSSFWKEILLSAAGGMLTGFLIFILAWFLSRKSMGMGDVKLAAVIGWYLGASLIWWDLVVCLSFMAVYSLIQLIRKKVNIKDYIPMAPFFALGTVLVLIMGF